RPKRDFIIDLNQSQSVPTCGSHACSPVPLLKRPPADFIWQVSPFQLAGGLYGAIEGSGIDYILPYWMARYYGVIVPPDVTSSAASTDALAPGELASIRNLNLPDGPVSVSVTDATGTGFAAQTVGASPGEVDFLVPDGMSPGQANFTFWTGDSAVTYSSMVVPIAPSLFTANQTGVGIADAMAVAVPAGNPDVQTVVPVFEFVDSGSAAVPITIPDNTDVFVTFLATGVRNVTPVTDVQVTIDGINVPLTYIGPVPGIQGMDQVIVKLITDLRGRGEANVAVTADGQISNVATINLQ